MTQTVTPFKDRNLRMARALPANLVGRPAKDLTSAQKRLARHLANDQEANYTGEEIMALVGFSGRINTFRRLLRAYNIKTHMTWMAGRNKKDC
jgi:hypothetical protein